MLCACTQYPELLVASYNNNEDAPHEPDGVALVWNLKYKKNTPEYTFHCQVSPPARRNALIGQNHFKRLHGSEDTTASRLGVKLYI